MALDLRTFLRLRPCGERGVCARLPGVGVVRSWDAPSLQALRRSFAGKRFPGGRVRLWGLPDAFCLGPPSLRVPCAGLFGPPCTALLGLVASQCVFNVSLHASGSGTRTLSLS